MSSELPVYSPKRVHYGCARLAIENLHLAASRCISRKTVCSVYMVQIYPCTQSDGVGPLLALGVTVWAPYSTLSGQWNTV